MGKLLKTVGVASALVLFVCLGLKGQTKPAGESIKPFDSTAKWPASYEAKPDKSKRLHDSLPLIKPKMTYAEAVKALGVPDAVYDLREGFFSLSPQEDGLFVRYRDYFSFRAAWYLSKKGKLPNVHDKWFAVYVGNDGKTVLTRMANNVEIPK